MKRFLLLLVVVVILLFNYRLIGFNNGLKTVFTSKMPDDNVADIAKLLLTTDKIVYYDNPLGDGYICVVDSKEYGISIVKCSKTEIDALNLAGLLSSNLKPKEITPIPLWVYLAAAIIIILIPNKKRNN